MPRKDLIVPVIENQADLSEESGESDNVPLILRSSSLTGKFMHNKI